MVVRLVLVSMVAGLGLTVPTAEQVVGWKGGAERWVSARIAHWDATMPVGEESFVIVNDPEPIVVREVAQAGPAADPAERPAGTDEVSIAPPEPADDPAAPSCATAEVIASGPSAIDASFDVALGSFLEEFQVNAQPEPALASEGADEGDPAVAEEVAVERSAAPGAQALSRAVRLTREAVVAWANLLHSPAVVTIAR